MKFCYAFYGLIISNFRHYLLYSERNLFNRLVNLNENLFERHIEILNMYSLRRANNFSRQIQSGHKLKRVRLAFAKQKWGKISGLTNKFERV